MSRWAEYEFFVHVVETGSISKAAELINVSSPTASRRLIALEKRLGARLVERSTRRLSVTEVGEAFYLRCRAVLDDMAEAEEEVALSSSSPSGTLRVTASLSLMTQHVARVLAQFNRKYPKIKIQLIAANRYYDITDNDIDVAIRTREYEPDSSLIVRRLATTRRILAASPAYIQRFGAPSHPDELSKHAYLGYSYHSPYVLVFEKDGHSVTTSTAPIIEANDGQIAKTAAVAGAGILAQPIYVIYDELIAGRLVPIMTDWTLPEMFISLVYRRRKLIPAKTRAFLDFISEEFRNNRYEAMWEAALTKAHGKAGTRRKR